MKEHFDIIGGMVFLDKDLYSEALKSDNQISKMMGSCCSNIFSIRPRIQAGVESMTIDFTTSDAICIHQDPNIYVHQLQDQYKRRIRGHLLVDTGGERPVDLVINHY